MDAAVAEGSPPASPAYDRMRRLVQAAAVVLTGFLASRILGVVRNIVIAAHFGASTEYEAYLAAITVPDLVFQVLVGGAVGSAFIPVFKSYVARNDQAGAWHLTTSAINAALVVTGIASVVLAVFARPLMDLYVPGRDEGFRDQAASLAQVLLISPAVFAVSTFCSSVLNSFGRFAVAALAPLMYNLAIIAAAVYLSGPFGIRGLAYGAVAGAFLHLLVQVPALWKVGMRWKPRLDLRHPGVREVGRLFAPRIFGLGVVQLNQMLSGVLLASFLVRGSVAYLNYAWLMIMTPLAVAMAVGTAVFPTLSEANSLGRRAQFEQVFLLSLRMILFITIPASIGLMVLGVPVISLFFERGQFGPETTQATAYALVFYAIGLAGHATVEIVDRVFYALQDTRTPVAVAAGAIAANVVLSLVLMQTPLTFGGLALANSLAALLEGSVLLVLIARRLGGLDVERLGRSSLRILAASLVMALPIAWLGVNLSPLGQQYGTLGQAVVVGVCTMIGALLYGAVSLVFGSEEILTLRRFIRR